MATSPENPMAVDTRRVRVGRNDGLKKCHTVGLAPGVSWPWARTPPCAGAPPPQN